MKTKLFTIGQILVLAVFIVLFAICGITNAQIDTIAGWNFEDADKRGLITDSATFMNNPYTADFGVVSNKDIAPVSLIGGAKFSIWALGAPNTGNAPNTTYWLNGAGLKYWQVTVSTIGYDNLKLSSKQKGSDTGPRDFKVQYSIDGLGWNDIAGANIVLANDNFISGVLTNVLLPSACANQDTLRLRWIMSGNDAINGTMSNIGTSRIDDIFIIGESTSIVNHATIFPDNLVFNIDTPQDLKTIITWNDASFVVRVVNMLIPPDTLVLNTDYTQIDDSLTILTSYLQNQFTVAGQTHYLYIHFDIGNPAVLSILWDDNNITGATINPNIAQFDLSFPGNVNTTITWNDASNLVQITDNQPTPYTLQSGDFSLSGNILTINQSYLSSALLNPGEEINLICEFDQGDDVVFIIHAILSPPSPIVIAEWSFENANKRGLITDNASFIANPYTADTGIPANIDNSPIKLQGGSTFSLWVQGSGGTGTYAPSSKAWNAGADTKYWQIEISTQGYGELFLSSKQRSSTTGPANFKVQYSLNGTSWYDVSNSNIVCGDNFTAGVLNELTLPVECNNKNQLLIRWLMSNNTAVGGADVSTVGTNRIDDIIVKGRYITTEADIVEFSFLQQTAPALIDTVNQTVNVEVIHSTNLTNLVASFVLSPSATAKAGGVAQVSGVSVNDFTNPVLYTITAGDGVTTKIWTVTVTVAPPGIETEILTYTLLGQTVLSSDINNNTSTIDITISGTTYNNHIAVFTLSPGASAKIDDVLQESEVTVNDFNLPVIYTIIAEDGVTTRNWTVNLLCVINSIPEMFAPGVQVFPNPSNGQFSIAVDQTWMMDIIDATGRIIYARELQVGQTEIKYLYQPMGIYTIRLTNNEKVRTIRIVIE